MSSATGGGCRRAGSEPAMSAQGPPGAIRCQRPVTPRDHSTYPQSRKAHPPSRGKLPKQQGQRPAEKRQHGDLPEIATPPQARQAERLDQMDDHCQHQENGNRFRHRPLLAAGDAERQSADHQSADHLSKDHHSEDRHSEDRPISTRIGPDRHRSPRPPPPAHLILRPSFFLRMLRLSSGASRTISRQSPAAALDIFDGHDR